MIYEEVISSELIIAKKVLNEETGEYEEKDFIHKEKKKKKKIAGGWSMIYRTRYDQAMLKSCKSIRDVEMFIYIRDMFTHTKNKIDINQSRLAKELSVPRGAIAKLMKRMRLEEFIRKNEDGSYSMNPFHFVPYRAKVEVLQAEWNNEPNDSLIKVGLKDSVKEMVDKDLI